MRRRCVYCISDKFIIIGLADNTRISNKQKMNRVANFWIYNIGAIKYCTYKTDRQID